MVVAKSYIRVRTILAVSLFAACAGDKSLLDRPELSSTSTGAMHPQKPSLVARIVGGHPLDPLTPDEISAAVQAIRARGFVGATTYIPVIRLQEPSKDDVLGWKSGQPFGREAFAIVFEDTPPSGITHEIIVSLGSHSAKVVSDTIKPGVQPPVLNAEYGVATTAPFKDPRFQNAMTARGYGPATWGGLFCLPLSAGNYHIQSEAGRRLVRVTCLDAASTTNPWSRPIENLTAVVDLVTSAVIDVIDTGIVPQSTANGEFYNITQAPQEKPLTVVNPNGDDYAVDGHVVTSPRWQFHFKVEGRDGLIISTAKYNDHGNLRSVLYRANLSETFVPYADPTSNFYYRTYMDESEYGFGKSTQPLTPGKDCPENATYYDATITDDYGNPLVLPNAVCIFEEKEYLSYHHADIFQGFASIARTSRNLVLRYATIVGNYDYYFDWKFREDGSIGFRVGASGSLEAKGLAEHTVADATGTEDLKWGSLVDDRLGGPSHQHIFDVRLDMDIDGRQNSLVQLTPTVVHVSEPGSHRTSGWTVVPTQAMVEGPIDPQPHTQLTVFNEHKTNAVGNPAGYSIKSENDTTLLMTDEDLPSVRGAFAKHLVWVTPYDASERYIAGDYVFMADGTTDGIQNWTKAGRSVADRDIVVWVNIGFSHISRSEDWPLMGTEWFGSFELAPFNFFHKNPLTDLNDGN
ncbi:MAG TPA: hypothetical protein VHN14_12340 [Kofleriaceae bacterium]|jgi:primary-amine oxidase|nr:hypothetical protein [Kofleriaceae bacterium]